MRKLQIAAVGDPAEVVSLVEFDSLTPGPGQVLVEMEAATINASDFLYVSGRYFLTPQPRSDVGAEGVGRVRAVGAGVDDSFIGTRVVLLPTYRHGTWATHVVAWVGDVVVAPDDVDVLQLAMVGINPMTALRLLRDFGSPSSPQRWIGQTAGNSAVGEYLVKLSKHFGYRTVSVVRREAGAEQVRSWGGDRVLVDGDNLRGRLVAALDGQTFDLAVDSIGGPASTQLAHRLRFGGSLVTYAFLSGQPPTVELGDLIGNHAHLTGFWLVNWLQRAEPAVVQAAYREVVDLVADGTLSARIDSTLGLDEFEKAFALARSDGREGKILFTFD
jgi:mitochondrial enoyl-[acyl-carrier protein] reductase / trans-2-enoyl-CoA reductase